MTVNVRFPTDIHAQLSALAEDDDRSLNGEIVHAVRQYIAARRRAGWPDGTPPMPIPSPAEPGPDA